MKKVYLMLFAFTISITTIAQKDQLKSADKALKKNDYALAKTSIDQAEELISNADNKMKSKFYYLKGQTYAGLSKTSLIPENIEAASSSFESLFALEKEMGSSKYSNLAKPVLDVLISDVSALGIKSYQDKNYKLAKSELYSVYNMSKIDTAYLEYASNAAYLEADELKKKAQADFNDEKINKEEYDKNIAESNDVFKISLKYFKELLEINYTGIIAKYSIQKVETGEREDIGNKSELDLLAKSKDYTEPKTIFTESKQPGIIKNIAYVYVEIGEIDKAISAVNDARSMDPGDVDLILTEANLEYKLGHKDRFTSLMKEAIKLDPSNPTLYFNLGVMSMEQEKVEKAKEYYRKAIELKPEYRDAYVNLGSVLLEKDKVLVEEMNENLNDFDEYDKIKARQVELYKEVIPIYEKAFELKKDDLDTVRTLMSLYENIEAEDKFNTMRELYDSLK